MNAPLPPPLSACWRHIGDTHPARQGLEHATLTEHSADSVAIAFDEDGLPFRLDYRLGWDPRGRLRWADLEVHKGTQFFRLGLRADGEGHWQSPDGKPLRHLDGCIDIDIWPTPLTNSFPLWRSQMQVGQRLAFRMAWVAAPALSVEAKPQAYTRLDHSLYLFESLDGSGFKAELPLDPHGLVTDYPGLFLRVL